MLVAGVLVLVILTSQCLTLGAWASEDEIAEVMDAEAVSLDLNCRSALLMEARTGSILFEQNAEEALPPASVTKIMTLLLVMEALEEGSIAYSDMVTASAHACSMGGSQIFLEEGEQMSVEELLKSVIISSANDAAVALAEHISGTEEAFVAQMNRRAEELNMTNTKFENTNGLDDTTEAHLTSAKDIALMSRELLKHQKITEYSSIWMDSIRDGAFGLTNTNRLVRFYKGATGLKTGSTAKAGFCISATAEREGMHLICVIMGAESRDIRNAAAVSLLDWGFANYALYEGKTPPLPPMRVTGGVRESGEISADSFWSVVKKSDVGKIQCELSLPQSCAAPVTRGETIGKVSYLLNGTEIGSAPIIMAETVEKLDFLGLLCRFLAKISLF